MGWEVCHAPGCVAMVPDDELLCVVHRSVARRLASDVALKCYACGKQIWRGAWWFVRAEGAFHARAACMNARVDPSTFSHRPKA